MITFTRDWRGYANGSSVGTLEATMEALAVAEGAATYGGVSYPPNSYLDADNRTQALVDGGGKNYGLQATRSRRGASPGAALDVLGGSWTLVKTTSVGAATLDATYPIRTQPGVTPLLLSGTSTGASQYVRITQALAAPFVSREMAITVPIFIPDYTKIAQIGILVSSDAFASKNYATYYTPEFSGLHMVGLSERISQSISGGQQYTASGGMGTEESITHIRVQITLANTVTGAVSVGKPIVGAKKKSQIMMTVDDGEALIMRRLDSTLAWSPYEYATRSGIKLSFFLVSSLIGTAGYLTASDVTRILQDGHRVYVHGLTNLASLANDAARRADVEANIAGLAALGIPRSDLLKCYAYPNGVFETSAGDTSILQIMHDAGFTLARTAARRAHVPIQCGFHRPYTLPILGYYENVGSGGETAASAVKLVNDLVVNGGLGIFTFHKFVVGTPTVDLEIKQAEFITLCDQIVGHMNGGSMESVTPHDLIDEYGLTVPSIADL